MKIENIKSAAMEYEKVAAITTSELHKPVDASGKKVGKAYDVSNLSWQSSGIEKEKEREFYIDFFNTTVSSIGSGGNFIEALSNEYENLKKGIEESDASDEMKQGEMKDLDKAYANQAKYAAKYFSAMITFGFDNDYTLNIYSDPFSDFDAQHHNHKHHYPVSQLQEINDNLSKDIFELLSESENQKFSSIYELTTERVAEMSKMAKEDMDSGVGTEDILAKIINKKW